LPAQRIGGGAAFVSISFPSAPSTDIAAGGAMKARGASLVARILSKQRINDSPISSFVVQDKEVEVAREAASGLGKIGDERTQVPVDASRTDHGLPKFLEAPGGICGCGLSSSMGSGG
jgi:hypothetical protein